MQVARTKRRRVASRLDANDHCRLEDGAVAGSGKRGETSSVFNERNRNPQCPKGRLQGRKSRVCKGAKVASAYILGALRKKDLPRYARTGVSCPPSGAGAADEQRVDWRASFCVSIQDKAQLSRPSSPL